MATWTEKRKMYLTAYLIYCDGGAQIKEVGQPSSPSKTGDGKTYINWALDVRSCAVTDLNLRHLDEYYTPGGSGYVRVPHHVKPILRVFWKNMRRRKLIGQGVSIVNKLYEDGYEFS